MDPGLQVTIYLIGSLVGSVIAGIACYAKNRHAGYWIAFTFLFPPTVLLLLILPRGRGVHYYNDRRDDLD